MLQVLLLVTILPKLEQGLSQTLEAIKVGI
jgi:hypothetical protein